MKSKRGNCYVTCEALYHLLGGREAGFIPHTVRHEGVVHWYLVQRGHLLSMFTDTVIDPTVRQFRTKPPYHQGRGRGFLTKKPSKRAREMMKRMVWQ